MVKDGKDTFVSFVDLSDETPFCLNRDYDVVIRCAEVFGEQLHLFIEVQYEDKFQGMIFEKIDLCSEYFKLFVRACFAMSDGYVVHVSTDALEDVAGKARLKLRDGLFCVDWQTLRAEFTPVNPLYHYYQSVN